MAPLPETLVPVGRASSRWLVLLAPLLLWSSGCETLRPAKPVAVLPPTGQPGDIMATWDPNVIFAPDPLNQGRPTAALTGRVNLVDAQTETLIVGDGSMIVSLYEEHPQIGADGAPLPLEMWKITQECLRQSAHRDQVGWGYSLALPWSTYRPDIGSIRILVRYQPAKDGMPLYRDMPKLTLQNSGGNAQAMGQMAVSHSAVPGPVTGGDPTATQVSSYGSLGFTQGSNGNPHGLIQTTGYGPVPTSGTPSPGLIQASGGGKPQ